MLFENWRTSIESWNQGERELNLQKLLYISCYCSRVILISMEFWISSSRWFQVVPFAKATLHKLLLLHSGFSRWINDQRKWALMLCFTLHDDDDELMMMIVLSMVMVMVIVMMTIMDKWSKETDSSALKKSTEGVFCNFPIRSPPSQYFSKTINSRPHNSSEIFRVL